MIKNLPVNAGDSGDGSIPGSESPQSEWNGNSLSILARNISQTEEPGGTAVTSTSCGDFSFVILLDSFSKLWK